MNIIEAIKAMRRGEKVRRACHIGQTVAKCWLSLETVIYEEDDQRLSVEVIYFNSEVVTKGHGWVGTYPAITNKWQPQQSDLFADDFVVMEPTP